MEFVKFLLNFVEICFGSYLIGYATFLFISLCVGSSVVYKNMKTKNLKDKVNKNIDIPVSILIPAYNEELTVTDTIKSLLDLDYSNYEIIIIDDGSKDNTSKNIINYFGMSKVSKKVEQLLETSKVVDVYETSPSI